MALPEELVHWLVWFSLLPGGGLLLFGGITFLWARSVTLTRRRAWVVTIALSAIFLIVELVLIFKFAWVVPK